jgi:hypothetical protein
MTCFFCGGETTRDVINAEKHKPKKRAFVYASQRTIMIASINARHTMAESAEGKGETMVGAKEIATLI